MLRTIEFTDIHYSVIYRACQKRAKGEPFKRKGGQTALTDTEEAAIVECIQAVSKWGYPVDLFELRLIISSYLDDVGKKIKQFRNNFPGVDFAYGFVKRHRKTISHRMCENIKRSRACVSRETVNEYFDNLDEELKDIPADNIVNYDETNLSDDPGRKKILCKRGTKHAERVLNSSKSATSLMYAVSASGTVLPTYVVYRAKHLYDTWTTNGPPGARYNRTLSGWFDANCFHDWLKTVVIPYFQKFDGKKILIGDNLSSHLSFQAVKLCREHNIHFVFLPPNSTHLTQPLDVCYFRPLKYAWKDILEKWKRGPGRYETTIPKSTFPSLLKALNERVFGNNENAKSGFEATGIFPRDREKVLKHVLSSTGTNDSNDTSVAATVESNFEKFLRELHFGTSTSSTAGTSSNTDSTVTNTTASAENQAPKPRGRKKRITTEPGKSVCEEDFVDKNETRPVLKKRKKKKKRTVQPTSDVDSESDEAISIIQDSDDENEIHPPPKRSGRKKKCTVALPPTFADSELDTTVVPSEEVESNVPVPVPVPEVVPVPVPEVPEPLTLNNVSSFIYHIYL